MGPDFTPEIEIEAAGLARSGLEIGAGPWTRGSRTRGSRAWRLECDDLRRRGGRVDSLRATRWRAAGRRRAIRLARDVEEEELIVGAQDPALDLGAVDLEGRAGRESAFHLAHQRTRGRVREPAQREARAFHTCYFMLLARTCAERNQSRSRVGAGCPAA